MQKKGIFIFEDTERCLQKWSIWEQNGEIGNIDHFPPPADYCFIPNISLICHKTESHDEYPKSKSKHS